MRLNRADNVHKVAWMERQEVGLEPTHQGSTHWATLALLVLQSRWYAVACKHCRAMKSSRILPILAVYFQGHDSCLVLFIQEPSFDFPARIHNALYFKHVFIIKISICSNLVNTILTFLRLIELVCAVVFSASLAMWHLLLFLLVIINVGNDDPTLLSGCISTPSIDDCIYFYELHESYLWVKKRLKGVKEPHLLKRIM